MFIRDFLKREAIRTNNNNNCKLYKSSPHAANIALRNGKREYFSTKFLMYKNNPKNAWKTINEILGRSRKQNTVDEIKLPEKTSTFTEEIVDVFNDYFINVGPKLAETVQYNQMNQMRDFSFNRLM